jgi:hypothetical protein
MVPMRPRRALRAADFERKDVIVMCESINQVRSSGMPEIGKFERIVKVRHSEAVERANFPFDPGERP